MAIRNERYGTYNQTVGIKIDMDEEIVMLDPHDTPFQRSLPVGDPCPSIKVEWLHETLTPQSDDIAANTTGTGPWTVTVNDTNIFRVGDILWKEDAASAVQFVVDSVTNATVMVVSGFAGNTTGPGNSGTLIILGQYNKEGNDPLDPRSTERTTDYNYTQIMQEAVAATRTARTVGRRSGIYGQRDPYDHEVNKKFKELAIRSERSFVHGQRSAPASGKRFMGGALYYMTQNAQSGVKANALALIQALLKQSYENGGSAMDLMVSPAVKVAIDNAIEAASRRTTRTDTTGGSVIDHVMTSFGTVNITVNRFFPTQKGILYMKSLVKRRVMDGYAHELLAKTGDSDKGQIVCEHTLEVKNPEAHGTLTLTDA